MLFLGALAAPIRFEKILGEELVRSRYKFSTLLATSFASVFGYRCAALGKG